MNQQIKVENVIKINKTFAYLKKNKFAITRLFLYSFGCFFFI